MELVAGGLEAAHDLLAARSHRFPHYFGFALFTTDSPILRTQSLRERLERDEHAEHQLVLLKAVVSVFVLYRTPPGELLRHFRSTLQL